MTNPNTEAAARWAEDEFDRRTRLLEEDSLPRIDWLNPEYRVCWSEVVDRFFSDGTVKDWPGLRIEYDAARKQEIRRRKR